MPGGRLEKEAAPTMAANPHGRSWRQSVTRARMARIAYRPEIDGLRALAVLPVVFFHSGLKFHGGYVGVDVFFVISGYLITALIAADMAAGTFSLREFWERRIRRIMPAAMVTVAVSLVLGFFLMLPGDFEQLGESAIAQALLSANVYFHQTTGYFERPADTKPLLHFWSLAVEEQFYLVFPFLLLGLQRRSERVKVAVVGAIAVVSLMLSVVGVWAFPQGTFYLLPTRAWELAAGALLALNGGRLPLPESARAWTGWAGLGMIGGAVAIYDADTPFPGLLAVPPCLGAVLVIWSTAGERSGVKRWLSWRPLVWVGWVSYSLYLWHWPVKVFSHYWFTGLHSPLVMRVAVVVVSFGLAWLSWRYVETPFRARRGRGAMRPLVWRAVAASAAMIGVSAAIVASEGLPGRFPPKIVEYAAAYEDRPDVEEADLTTEEAEAGALPALGDPAVRSGPTVLVWGDSHARVVSPAVEEMCRQLGVRGWRASRSETASLLDWGEEEVREHNEAVFRWIERMRPTVVVLASRWEKVLREPEDEESLRATVERVRGLGVSVGVMRQVASQQKDIPKALARAELLGDEVEDVGVPVEVHEKATRRSNEIIDRVRAAVPGVLVLDPIPYLSREARCVAELGGRPLYYDYQHLTTFGAEQLTPMFAALLRAVVNDRGRSEVVPRGWIRERGETLTRSATRRATGAAWRAGRVGAERPRDRGA
jgi:Predicted acyltransferases